MFKGGYLNGLRGLSRAELALSDLGDAEIQGGEGEKSSRRGEEQRRIVSRMIAEERGGRNRETINERGRRGGGRGS